MTEQVNNQEQPGKMSPGLEFHLLRAISGMIYPDELAVVKQVLVEEGYPTDMAAYTLELVKIEDQESIE